jgi:hypothetical protein
MYEAYFTKRLLETLKLAEEAPSAEQRSIHLRASRYYRELLESSDSRQTVRHPVRVSALLHYVGPSPRPVIVSDISTAGFRIQFDQQVRPGRLIALQMDGLAPLDAYVIWQREDQVGCKFLSELHPALLEAALAVSPRVD